MHKIIEDFINKFTKFLGIYSTKKNMFINLYRIIMFIPSFFVALALLLALAVIDAVSNALLYVQIQTRQNMKYFSSELNNDRISNIILNIPFITIDYFVYFVMLPLYLAKFLIEGSLNILVIFFTLSYVLIFD